MTMPFLLAAAEANPGFPIPAWAVYLIILVALGLVVWQLVSWTRRSEALDAEYVTPPGPLTLKVRVKGLLEKDLAHFSRCWNEATTCLARSGPWKKEELVAKLAAYNKVNVMPVPRWKNAQGQMVGGELIGGVLHVGPNLDVLCHELVHRAEECIDATKMADTTHKTWPLRGFTKADNEYRAWLQEITGAA